ncbi:PDZ domain-containing protein [Scytonema sp. UIC 10036]|uniref:HhoA/HhoB/HtrA family serine endopeptidase n=1 Tax=Scytonema sp. UIC 10036 TaxID=2304196 RepID=UPI0012DABFD8|nr:HhoA/HhoB/HtrA family serine endopeptidase [Scytonema sp. UIC 10036]MUG92237.1 PDZ domain-containing protein [Scytonema sp. UIC 10036]
MKTSKHNFQDRLKSNIGSTANNHVNGRNRKKPMTYLGLALVVAGTAITVTGMHPLQAPQAALAVTQNPPDNLATARSSNFITEVVDRVGPAVVRIDSTHTVKHPTSDIFNDPFFREFFGSEVPSPPSKEIVQGVGSGFILNSNGEVLTNAHVVNGADTVTVTLKDGRSFKGQVMGADPVTDVAVVKIKSNNLPTIPLGNSEQLKPGEWAIAIGNPLGLDNTVTEGIISATGRSSSQVGVPSERVNFIQTDAAINPGNSGGPLLNSQGQAIGINTAIIQNAQGLGFAIPINTAKHIANQLIAKGKVEHAYLGVQMVTLTPELKQQINNNPNAPLSVDESQGVLVVKVVPESPAAKGGIRAGDVIVKVNNESINKADKLQQTVEETSIGSNLQLEIRRNGQTLNLGIKPGALPNTQQEG